MTDLTPNQRQVLVDAANGLGIEQTAVRRGVSRATVASRRKELRAKLGARNMAHAVKLAWDLCLIGPQDFPENGSVRG